MINALLMAAVITSGAVQESSNKWYSYPANDIRNRECAQWQDYIAPVAFIAFFSAYSAYAVTYEFGVGLLIASPAAATYIWPSWLMPDRDCSELNARDMKNNDRT